MTAPMSRIPLSKEEELTVGSMSRWMRFMSVVGICAALVMVLVVVLTSGTYSTMRGLSQASSDPKWANAHAFFESLGAVPYALAAVFLLFAGVVIWQNMMLYHAGDDFHLVATEDTSDVEYLARRLDRLRTFFKIHVLTAAVAFTIVLVTGLVAATLAAHSGAAR